MNLQLFQVIATLLAWTSKSNVKGDITLVGARRAVLLDEQLTFVCVISGNTLVWKSSLDSATSSFIGFIRSVDPEGTTYTLPSVGFVAVLSSKANSAMNSTLNFTATQRFNGSAVLCTNGAFSPVFSKTVYIAVAPEAPVNISVANYTLDSVTLVWNPPLFDGLDDITRYDIVVSNDWVPAANVSTAKFSVTIQSLQYGVQYSIAVKAVNRVGASPGSVLMFKITPKEPPEPANFTVLEQCGRNATLLLRWHVPPLTSLVPGPVIATTVNITRGQITTSIHVPPDVTSFVYQYDFDDGASFLLSIYLNTPSFESKRKNAEIIISNRITSTNVVVQGTSATLVFTFCYLIKSTTVILVLYSPCDQANNITSLQAAFATQKDGEESYHVILPCLSANRLYCYTLRLYNLDTWLNAANGSFLTNGTSPSCFPTQSDSYNAIVIAAIVSASILGAVVLALLVIVLVLCRFIQNARATECSTELQQKAEPHHNLDSVCRTTRNPAYFAMTTENTYSNVGLGSIH